MSRCTVVVVDILQGVVVWHQREQNGHIGGNTVTLGIARITSLLVYISKAKVGQCSIRRSALDCVRMLAGKTRLASAATEATWCQTDNISLKTRVLRFDDKARKRRS